MGVEWSSVRHQNGKYFLFEFPSTVKNVVFARRSDERRRKAR